MIVHKFGGTSVGDAQRFAGVAEIVLERQAQDGPGQTVVVVSAMSGVTNALIAGARAAAEGRDVTYREVKANLLTKHLAVVESLLSHSLARLEVGGLVEDRLHDLERLYRSIAVLGEVTVRGCDAVASFGEQLSSNILAAVLRERGARAQAVSATELIVTDDHFGAATPLMEPTRERLRQRIVPLLEQGVIPVITGYIGATERGVTTTLGRGGSDYSAALVGAGLAADEVWIWSDVDGILTADPNIVPQARTLAELSYIEAADLAYFGADVLHPKTVRPVVEHGIPLRILNSFNPTHPGTRIVESPSPERERLPAIISTTGLTMVAIGSQDGARAVPTWTLPMAARVLQRLGEAHIEVLMFSQSFSEQSLNLVVREQDQTHCLSALRREFGGDVPNGTAEKGANGATCHKLSDACTLGVKERVATISVVGDWEGEGAAGGVVSRALAALGKHGTRLIAVTQAAARHSVSFCVPEEQMADTVRFLHRELGLG